MKKLLTILFSLIAIVGYCQSPTSVYWLKSRVDGSVPTPVAGWGSLYFDYIAAKWKICAGTTCYDLPVGTTTRNNLPPSVHTSSFTLNPADTSKMHILSGGSGAIVITMGTFSSLSGKGLQFAFRRDRVDTVYFATGSETIIQSPGATLGVADSTFAYLYYNGTTDKFYLANGGSGGSSGGGGTGTVTDVSVTTANGVSGSVATSTTTPAITIALGAITPTSVNGVVVSGSSTPTLAVTGPTAVSGTNTGDQTSVTGNAGTATALQNSRTIGIVTGDATSSGSSFDGTANNTNALTLATVNSNVGTFGSATLAPILTVNGKGLITAVSTATITPAVGSITGLGTGVATWLATPSSSNLIAAITDEIGTGRAIFGPASPTADQLLGRNSANTDNEWKITSTGAAVTVTDGTYIDLGLNGSPTTGAVNAFNITAEIAGQIPVDHGGTGFDNTTQTYTPTLTNTANLAASTASVCMYYRIGNMVTVSGRVTIDPTTTATLTTLGISLPVASAFTTAIQAGGTAAAPTVADGAAAILSDATNDRATLQYVCTDVTNHDMYFTFTYQVL